MGGCKEEGATLEDLGSQGDNVGQDDDEGTHLPVSFVRVVGDEYRETREENCNAELV